MATTQEVPKDFNPEEAQNFEDIEKQFAVKAVIQAQTYWGLLEMRKGSELRLTKLDDDIYTHFKETFPDLDVAKKIDENEMKNAKGKETWRNFMMAYENTVDDYNFGTLLRTEAKEEYGEKSTIFAMRMQFYAIEIARNRLGLNDWVYEEAQKQKSNKS